MANTIARRPGARSRWSVTVPESAPRVGLMVGLTAVAARSVTVTVVGPAKPSVRPRPVEEVEVGAGAEVR